MDTATKTKETILIIAYNDYPGYEGTVVRIRNHAAIFLENGFKVTIFAPNIDNRRPKEEYLMGCQIIRTNIFVPKFLKRKRILARAWSMLVQTIQTPFVYRKFFKKLSIKVIQAIHVYSIPPAIIIRFFKRKKITVDDAPPVSDMLSNAGSTMVAKFFTLFEKILFRFCHLFIYTSPALVTYYKRRGAKATLCALNGVNCNEFKPLQFNSDRDKTILFFNGSTFSRENCAAIENFVEIGKKLIASEVTNLEFRLVCWPKYNLPASVCNDIDNEKTWLSYKEGVEDIVAEMEEADIALLPFSQDHDHVHAHGARLKVLEYMACGKLVISTSEGVEGVNGLIPGEHFLLAKTIEVMPQIISEIINSPDTRKKMGESAREFVLNNYDWRKTTAELVEACNLIV